MIMPFETLNVDVNCLGNHEMDFGWDKCIALMKQTSSPWLMTNLVKKISPEMPILNCQIQTVKTT